MGSIIDRSNYASGAVATGINASCTISFASTAGVRWRCHYVAYGFHTAPTNSAAVLTVSAGADTVLKLAAQAAGPVQLNLPVVGTVSGALSVTLASGGADINGFLTAYAHPVT